MLKRKIWLITAIILAITAMLSMVSCGSDNGTVTIEFVTGTDESIPTQVRSVNDMYDELPVPTREYYKFLGWTTQNTDDGEIIGADFKPSGGNTYVLYARWQFVGKGITRRTIAGNFNTHYVLDDDGVLWAWGDGSWGQLGTGSLDTEYTPQKVKFDGKFIEVETNGYCCYAIDTQNRLWAWGRNDGGELGNGTLKQSETPVEVIKIPGVSKVSASSTYAYALDLDGNIWVWGDFTEYDPDTRKKMFNTVPVLVNCDAKFIDIAVGGGGNSVHGIALDEDGHIWTFGNNSYGQLGNGTTLTEKVVLKTQYTPRMIMKDTVFTQIAAGIDYSLAIDSNGELWAWGNDQSGSLGALTWETQDTPIKISGLPRLISLYSTGYVNYAIDENNSLWYWGDNSDKLYIDSENSVIPQPIKILDEYKFSEISLALTFDSNYSYLAKDTDGNIWGWGDNSFGLVADGQFGNQFAPNRIMGNNIFSQIASGDYHSLALDSNGHIWAWGENTKGQLGDGSETNRRTPVQILPDAEFKYIAASARNSYALDIDGNIWAWGENSKGQLGDGTYVNKNTPQKLNAGIAFDSIYVGDSCAFAIDTSGRLYTWGLDRARCINTEYNKSVLAPTRIFTDMRFTNVVYNCPDIIYAKDTDGKIWKWDGSTFTQMFVDIDIDTIAIDGSGSNALALDADGNLWAWGNNLFGTLQGQNAGKAERFISIKQPKIIDEGTAYSCMDIASSCAFAVTQTGILVGWGTRVRGTLISQLGKDYEYVLFNGTTFFSVAVFENDIGFCDVALGYYHGVALDNDGHVYTWGRNNVGQLGNSENPSQYPIRKIILA